MTNARARAGTPDDFPPKAKWGLPRIRAVLSIEDAKRRHLPCLDPVDKPRTAITDVATDSRPPRNDVPTPFSAAVFRPGAPRR